MDSSDRANVGTTMMGTPKSLQEAINNAICIGPMKGMDERLHAHVRDYISQKFTTMMFKDPKNSDMLMTLFKRIVGEE